MTGTLHMGVFLPLAAPFHMRIFLPLELHYFQGKNLTKVTQCGSQALLIEDSACLMSRHYEDRAKR